MIFIKRADVKQKSGLHWLFLVYNIIERRWNYAHKIYI